MLEPIRDGRARKKFDTTVAYLKHVPQAAEIINRLQRSTTDYKVEIVDRELHPWTSADAAGFDSVANVVHWDPDLAFEWHGTFHGYHAHSPAITLMHEFGHAYHKDVDPAEFLRLVSQRPADPRWTNLEEKRTILEIENPVAAALGESPRYFHAQSSFQIVQLYASMAPTSASPAQQRSWFMPISTEPRPLTEPRPAVFESLSLAAKKANEPSRPDFLALSLPARPTSPVSRPQFTPISGIIPSRAGPRRPTFLPLPSSAPATEEPQPPLFEPISLGTQ